MPHLTAEARREAVRSFTAGLTGGALLLRPKDWQSFERLIRDLFERITGDVHMDLNGRSGQSQSGVDVFGVDQRTRAQIGTQCRGRGDGSDWNRSRLTPKELREEVRKARVFAPKLDVFIVLTTGPNDVGLKKAAAAINECHAREGGFELQVHGWDWIEGKMSEHADLAIRYGLIATGTPLTHGVDKQIGLRFIAALELMNERRSVDARFTLQGISKHLNLGDWRRIEAIAEGISDATSEELAQIAGSLGINEAWLLEGKQNPFFVDPQNYRGAEEQFDAICRLKPRRIVFVRMMEGDFESLVVAEVDDFRWVTFTWDHPTSSHVGGTGSHQLLEYCALMRRLYQTLDHGGVCRLYGKHLAQADFMRLWEGDVYPGTLLNWRCNDTWWIDFAELADARISEKSLSSRELKEAIQIARSILGRYQDAKHGGWLRTMLAEARLPINGRDESDCFPLDLSLR